MPHIIVEYSAPLDDSHDIHALCTRLFDSARDSGIFGDIGAIKVRAAPCPYWLIGTEPQSFVHTDVHLLAGRDETTKAGLAKALLAAMDAEMTGVGSLSVDIHDMNPKTYAKRTL